jgi:hypothetical protein
MTIAAEALGRLSGRRAVYRRNYREEAEAGSGHEDHRRPGAFLDNLVNGR